MFTDISDWITHNPPARSLGVAVLDVDGDGRFEFVIAGSAGPNRVLKCVGGQLRDATPPALAEPDRSAVGLAAGDLDGDGVEELYILHPEPVLGSKPTADRLFKRNLDGNWADLFARPENRTIRNPGSGRSVAVLDRRGVGRYGFYISNSGRPARLYEMTPDGVLTDLAPALALAHVTAGQGVLAAPLFATHTDLFCANEDGPNVLFRNHGDGTFRECAGELRLADAEEHGRGVTVVDAGGQLALCWGNWDGPHRLMVPQHDGTWRDRATPGLAFPAGVQNVIAADFDNDGADELFFHNRSEANRLFRVGPGNDPDVRKLDPGQAAEPDGLGTGAAVADIDGDGVLELLLSHGDPDPQPLGMYKATTAAGNGWLRVFPLTRFGAPARGAVVRAEAAGRTRVKVIDGGSGYLCQMEPVAHFGLGDVRSVDRVTVTWPDGTAAVVENPPINRLHTVPFPYGV
jgi:hypothetical protein